MKVKLTVKKLDSIFHSYKQNMLLLKNPLKTKASLLCNVPRPEEKVGENFSVLCYLLFTAYISGRSY